MEIRRTASIIIAAFMTVAALAGCAPEGESSSNTDGSTGASVTPAPQTPEIGSIAYDEHLCEFTYTGTGLRDGWDYYEIDGVTYCYVQVGQNLYDAYPLVRLMGNNWSPQGLQPVFRRDFGDGNGGVQLETLYVMLYSDRLWRRIPEGTSAVEVYYNDRWVTLADYNLLEQQRLATESAATQQAAEAARQQSAIQLAQIQERIIGMGMVWTQPECNFSYNGCA